MSQTTKDLKDPKGGGKPRVFALAAELNLETKTVLEFCKELGFSAIKNQLNALEPEQVDAIKERVKKGPKAHAAPAAPLPVARPTAPPKVDTRIPTLGKPKPVPPPAVKPAPAAPTSAAPAPTPILAEPAPVPSTALLEPPALPAAPPVAPTPAPVAVAAPSPAAPEPKPEPAAPAVVAAAVPEPTPAPAAPVEPASPPVTAPPNVVANRVPNITGGRPPVIGQTRPPVIGTSRPPQILPPRTPPTPPSAGPRPAAPATPPAGTTPPRPPAPAASGPVGGPPRPPAPTGPTNPGRPAFNPPPAPPGAPRPLGQSGGPPRAGGPGRPAFNPPPGPGGFRSGGPGGPPRPGGPIGAPPGVGAGGPGRPPMKMPAPPPGGAAAKSVKLTLEQIQRLRDLERQRGGKMTLKDAQNLGVPPVVADPNKAGGPAGPGGARGPGVRGPGFPPRNDEPEGDGKTGPGGKKPGEVAGRGDRHKARADKGRQRGPTTDRGAIIIGAGGRVDMIDRTYGSRAKIHRGKRHVIQQKGPVTGKVEIALPITVRSLSEAIGMKGGELLLNLKKLTNELFTINSGVEFDVAELLASEKGIELVAKKQANLEAETLGALEKGKEGREEHQVPRPPIVTIMGHVDHGKTSLLDKIRQQYGLSSDVVSTEAGGITQVIRAWRVQKDDKSTTFLDTPGHEAFTKMRARGANVTDIAVIVVSAADGIMPQTQEAVAHAKAAEVDIIVAINKVDLPGANPEKVKNQLYSMELVPEDMGGDVPVILTSAVTGQGVGELLDAIALLSELADLKADPDQPASGTCLEAYLDPEEGVRATLLVQEGTLHRGDVMLCGATFGKVRAMYDDMGRPIEEAGPSTPVLITGLDEVPDADDPFYAVPEVATAREIAGKRKDRKQDAALHRFTPVSMDMLKERNSKVKITELKIILKAEARGSVEAIKKELEKLVHEEVRTRVLHAGIGAISESDVTLALTSPDDTLIVGFNVTADDQALRLADQRGISDKIREYDIIYKLTDDIKGALEGKLKPIEEVVHLGRAVVRQTFKVGKVGVIAGCHVTSGTIERNARVRLIREGVVMYPPSDKHVGLDSLKRFKDDVKEVREGFECGLRITGYDDIKVGDVIEAFKIEIKQRTL